MSIRVSTTGNYTAVLANLMAAQQRQAIAGNEVATQKKGDDLKGFARHAEMLTAMRSIQTRTDGYLDQHKMLTDKLAMQDTALSQVMTATRAARQAIADALASGSGDTLMVDLQGQFQNAVEGLNTRYGGKFLFAGGQIDTRPVTATNLSDITAGGTVVADFFANDDYVAASKVDDSLTLSTGLLADDIGTDVLSAFKAMQAFEEGGSGPFDGTLTAAQRTFLEGQLAAWDQVGDDFTERVARNGLTQQRLESVRAGLESRQTALTGMVGDLTDADMAEAATRLEQAQISVQAAAQVFMALKESSLLNLLR